jgi:polar amino acid transport system substrate-binding protein
LSLQPYFLPYHDSGLAYDTIRAAFFVHGHRVLPVYASRRRVEALLDEESDVDCLPMIAPGFEHGWHAVRGAHFTHDYAITAPGRPLRGLEDLANGRVLAYPGAQELLGEPFREVVARNPHYREINSHRAQLHLLRRGQIDVVIADRMLAEWYLEYLAAEDGAELEFRFHRLFEPVWHDFVCRDPAVSAAFSAGLEQITADGTLSAINAKYGASHVELTPQAGATAPESESKREGERPGEEKGRKKGRDQ